MVLGDHIFCRGWSGGTKFSAVDGPGGLILGGTNYHMTQHHLTFLNNRAGLGGNELYGGGLQHACNHNCKGPPQRRSNTKFLTLSDIKNTTLSYISSDPSGVCLYIYIYIYIYIVYIIEISVGLGLFLEQCIYAQLIKFPIH